VPDLGLGRLGVGVICHGTGDGQPPQPPAHYPPDCGVCPLCMAFASPAIVLAKAVAVPRPRVGAIGLAVVLPPATAPPRTVPNAAQPRGPPYLA
jgi:hypothetical protein